MKIQDETYLAHYGILRRSGRYPWGSTNNVPQRSRDFLDYVQLMKNKGLTESEIARGVGLNTTELRAARSIANNAVKQADINMAQRLKDKGWANTKIAERMGKNESSIRAMLKPGEKDKADQLTTISNMIKDQVDKHGYISVGSGVENHLGVTRDRLAVAVAMLKEQGYSVNLVKTDQMGTAHQTTNKVISPPGTSQKDAWMNRDKIRNMDQVGVWSEDRGRSILGLVDPKPIEDKRVGIRYAEDGGADADGVIYIRPGVDDVSLGGSHYAQVRIAVNGTHYLKGMAVYRDDLPDGVDLLFNTNKSNTGNKLDAMKPLKTNPDGSIDKDNPFGATIDRQIIKRDATGKEHTTSVMNIVNDEGDWDEWSKNLSSQMLSKQSSQLAKSQLNMTYEQRRQDLDHIKTLTNPAVKRKLLESYADDVDAAAVHLKAAALPRQRTQVILPINSLKDNEIYAPNFDHGEVVVLIRYPHGGTFEIPELKVNNRHPKARQILGNQPKDAVGINSKVAERLSGADFDGDTVLVIPNNNRSVKSTPPLEGLKNFDPQRAYPAYEGMKKMSEHTKQVQMGEVSNLITDMTIRGANLDELARAVRHSMVVIDAEKHNLNYRQSAIDNGIANLKEKYQGRKTGGASTLISRAGSTVRVPERKQTVRVDPTTGEKIYFETGRTYVNEKGDVVPRTTKSKKLAEAKDATTLSSGTPMEKLYADHSNKLKALANEARKTAVNTKTTPWSESAKKTYAKEVASLDRKLNAALKNAPLERQAQIIAGASVSAKRRANPDMSKAELKKLKYQALAEARARTGAGKALVEINWDEWNAIQAGAVSNNKLKKILDNSDLDQVKEKATPRENTVMSTTKVSRASSMMASGYTQAEIARALGVSLSTLKSSIERGEV